MVKSYEELEGGRSGGGGVAPARRRVSALLSSATAPNLRVTGRDFAFHDMSVNGLSVAAHSLRLDAEHKLEKSLSLRPAEITASLPEAFREAMTQAALFNGYYARTFAKYEGEDEDDLVTDAPAGFEHLTDHALDRLRGPWRELCSTTSTSTICFTPDDTTPLTHCRTPIPCIMVLITRTTHLHERTLTMFPYQVSRGESCIV
ncbi:MAG: hypothetical protein V3V08_24860 [Nannocystaceae bacterium]